MAMFAGTVIVATATAATATPAAPSCAKAALPKPRQQTRKPPGGRLDPIKRYDVTLETSCGSFTIRLDVRHSPRLSASFASLARTHYFDHTVFHRIIPTFVVQGGDPTASGSGGPGYSTVDKPPASTRYTKYTVAMAKTPTEPPGTAGSQFFVVTGPAAAQLPPEYAVLGKVYVGRAVVDLIGRQGDAQTEQPTRVIEIRRTTVKVS